MQEQPAASWAKANAANVRDFDPQKLAERASEKAHRATNAQELPPGRYTVILEPSAVLDIVGFLFYDFAATALADKRSCLNDRMGKQVFGKNITVVDDAYHPLQLGAPFDGEGMPRERVLLVDEGVPKNLVYSRASAKAARKKPTGHGFALPNEYGEAPMNLVFGGGKASLEEMIASTDRGLLVTRLWYIREVDPYEKDYDWDDARWVVSGRKGEGWRGGPQLPLQSVCAGDAAQRRAAGTGGAGYRGGGV